MLLSDNGNPRRSLLSVAKLLPLGALLLECILFGHPHRLTPTAGSLGGFPKTYLFPIFACIGKYSTAQRVCQEEFCIFM